MTSATISFPWFQRQDYQLLRSMFSDGDRLPATFDAWHGAAMDALKLFQKQELPVVQVCIEPDAFHAWCVERAVRADYRARHQFATELAGQACRLG